MKPRRIALVVVVAAAAALIIYKVASPRQVPTSEATSAATTGPQVVLVADSREAESSCGCGEIIRTVRSAGENGVNVLEIAPGSDEALRYGTKVVPTVLVLDPDGKVLDRFEGEDRFTISAVRQRLEKVHIE